MSTPPAPAIHAARNAVIVMFVLNGALFGVWASRIPTVSAKLSLDPGALGMLLLLMGGGAIAAFPLAGRWVDRHGAARTTVWIAAIHALSILGIGLAPSVATLAGALFFFGATHGAMDVAMNSWAGAVERHLPRPMMSRFHASWSVGAGIGAASGYGAIKLGLPLLAHAAIVIGVVAAVSLWLAAPPSKSPLWAPKPPSSAAHAPLFSLPKGSMLLVGLIAMCASLGEGAMADWGAIFLMTTTGVTEASAAIGYAVFSVAMVIMRLGGDRVTHRIGPVRTARMAGIIATIGVGMAVGVASYPVTLIGFALMGVGYAVIMPLAFSRATSDPVLSPGKAVASLATLGYGGLLLGPPVIGFIADATSIRVSFAMLMGLAALMAALAPALARPH
ncbi:MFS transporter [Aliiroseovarius sp. S1339]|uniref:MFS transporter n=1 Tax=Aliiroseovarius sp. S1339 TaxID=2936990 RepID=UPI0020C15722|nr:MFS transporter [Aliiroseovarius sp. S1339]MCK8465129.1 MFS transporter [Aliiroseovarius sp. S1339]